MKLNINLQPVNNTGSGIAKYANELTMFLSQKKEHTIQGVFNFVRNVHANDFSRFTFKVRYSYIPYKLVYSRLIKKPLPIKYSYIAGQNADINLFFTYRIPRVKYTGITISTIHDLIPLKTETESEKVKKQYINDVKYTAKHSDYIITVSNCSKKDIVDILHYDPNKIIVIPNGVDFKQFNQHVTEEKKLSVKRKYKIPDNYILYMGGIRKHKNIDNLIRAYSLLDVSLKKKNALIITKGNANLKKLVSELDLNLFVKFIPFVDEEDKVCIYQMAKVFAFISSYEGFGIPVIEAQAAGTPVITSGVSSLKEIGEGSSILVDPNNLKSIHDGLEKLLTNESLCKEIVTKGYNNAKKYSWQNAGDKLNNFLQKVINF